MEGSGAIVNVIPVVAPDGTDTRTQVIASHDSVEIGGWTFKRDELLFAMGVKQERKPHGR